MDYLFNEIERGLDARVYQLSLGMALCIPDICAALESYDGKTSGSKYRAWYDKYVSKELKLSSSDCYYFRCSFLHQGSTEHEKSNYDKIIFIEPNPRITLHNNIIDNVLNIDINIFCRELVQAGRDWYEFTKDAEKFIENYGKSFKRYPNGLAPYIVGIPVYG